MGHSVVSDAEWFDAHSLMYRILTLLSRHQVPRIQLSPDNPMLLVNCIREIHEHYSQPLTLAMLAEKFSYSESSLYRIFSQKLGTTFLDYLTGVRLNIACGMLQKNEHTVAEIADLCGFPSYNTFYRIFRQRVGAAPREYRENSAHLHTTPWSASEHPFYRYNEFEAFPVLPTDSLAELMNMVKTSGL